MLPSRLVVTVRAEGDTVAASISASEGYGVDREARVVVDIVDPALLAGLAAAIAPIVAAHEKGVRSKAKVAAMEAAIVAAKRGEALHEARPAFETVEEEGVET